MNKGKIVVLGAGESGVGAAILANKIGYDIFVSDYGKIKEKYRNNLIENKISFEENKHTLDLILDADKIIKSPGIPDNAEIVKKAENLGIDIIDEIEFASRLTDAKIIAITGSNGKTTTTMLTYHILKKAGLNVGLSGNVGFSFALNVANHNFDIYVLEISSFQLDRTYSFKPDIAVITNITPDHLDRYVYSYENYISSKFKITKNQTEKDSFIYSADDETTNKFLDKFNIRAKKYSFSIGKTINEGAYLENGNIVFNINNNKVKMELETLALQGKHNIYNSMAAGIASRIMEIRNEVIKESFSDYQNVPHRLEFVAKVHGIEFINDSKATNVNSTWYALECMTKPTVWIVGGQDKGNDYSSLRQLVKQKVKAIVCLGVDNSKILNEFSDLVSSIEEATSASEAVQKAYHLSDTGDVVLLSPACASFDLFENFEDRGNKFKKAVNDL